METPTLEGPETNETKETKETKETNEKVILDEDNISQLSYSSFDSIDKEKLSKLGQYTCDECPLIPKIINTDISTKTITFKCEIHGQKTMDIKSYVCRALNYNTNSWTCASCRKVQRDIDDKFVLCCDCGAVYCEGDMKIHQKKENHKNLIYSDKFLQKCEKHCQENYVGYCFECKINFCEKCEKTDKTHKWHETTELSEMTLSESEIAKIENINKEYKRLISYYEGLIKVNELIIDSFRKSPKNYYNCYNFNSAINVCNRNKLMDETKISNVSEDSSNLITYMNKLYPNSNLNIKIESDKITYNNKNFNNDDLKIMAQIPFRNLRFLSLENNSISRIDCLEHNNFENLIILNLNNNGIEDISILENVKFLDSIQALFLRSNAIKDISVFKKCKFPSLRQLDLRNNVIEDLLPFEKMNENLESLQSLLLKGNKYDKKKFDTVIAAIQKLADYSC